MGKEVATAIRGAIILASLYHPGQKRLLGEQDRQAPHRTLQGDWQVWLHLGPADSRPPRYRHRVCPHSQEAPADGGYRGLLHQRQGLHRYTRQLRQGDVRRYHQDLLLLDTRSLEGDSVPEVSLPRVHRLPGQEPPACRNTETRGEEILNICIVLSTTNNVAIALNIS